MSTPGPPSCGLEKQGREYKQDNQMPSVYQEGQRILLWGTMVGFSKCSRFKTVDSAYGGFC